ncbi:MAG: hypothetical protein ABS45_06160 [Comamonas sp. SCN 65-56]|uniref:hypothetical protein n=1 Tax=Comamonas sp. SCN 65-56 TaxID=1660095 RepID=UPI00086C02F6|nr:hypothetical protein [Comamonas sp. SCN 65-56]ODS92779.1 MAG: hypothetical protein ABS45_06160 [Comamonas sp. SCN 65-56]
MRALFLLALSALATAAALAQNPKENTSQPAPDKGEQLSQQEAADSDKGQRIERIVVEDAGSRIDELRVGGETRSITVQPKVGGKLPAYEVRPNNGTRVWNLGRF